MADTETPPHLPPKRILIIEDDASMAALIWHYLAQDSMIAWTPCVAETLADALTQIATAPPVMILLDLNLPDSKDLSTLRQLFAALPVVPLIPIVVITGQEGQTTEAPVLLMGAGYIGKDHLVEAPDEFLRTLHALVQAHG